MEEKIEKEKVENDVEKRNERKDGKIVERKIEKEKVENDVEKMDKRKDGKS